MQTVLASDELDIENTEQIYKAVKDFIHFCSQNSKESLPAENIFLGNQNNLPLPQRSNEYCVFTVIGHNERGTPVRRYSKNTNAVFYRQLEEVTVQIDSYSDDPETARLRAQTIKTLCRTDYGVAFFNQYGISCNYAESVRNNTTVVDADQYVNRWTTTINLSYVHRIAVSLDFFDKVKVKVKPVDSFLP